MKKKWYLFVVVGLLFGCSTFKRESVTYIDYPEVLNEAKYYFANRNFERAESEVQRYLNSAKDVYWHGHAYLMLGEIREQSGREAEAAEAYRKVIGHSAGYHSAAASQAMYRLSWIYERDKKYNDLLITLLDLQRSLGQGDNFVKLVETPARLANVYYVLNQWDRAIEQRNKIPDEVLDKYKGQAKSPEVEFQVRLYRALLAMTPTTMTPYKSQDILTLTQKELLATAEISTPEIAEKAFGGLESEYNRYFSQVRQLPSSKNPVVDLKRNQEKLVDLAKFLDFIEELRASKRPPELVSNQQMNLAFFKKLQALEDQTRALSKKLEIGIQKAKKDNNELEPFADAPEKKSAPLPKPKKPQKL